MLDQISSNSERKRVYCLYRVSTIGQVEKDDIPMQKQFCREYCQRQPGWEIVKEFSEKGVSGFKVSAKDRPRYLMGVGTPGNIIEGVWRGVDLFDCVMPARNGRHAHLFTKQGIINLKNEKYARDEGPIDPACGCPVCRRYSRAYLRHLIKAEEALGLRLAVMHNLWFYNNLLAEIRAALEAGTFAAYRAKYTKLLDTRI